MWHFFFFNLIHFIKATFKTKWQTLSILLYYKLTFLPWTIKAPSTFSSVLTASSLLLCADWLPAGPCCPNKIKNHHFVFCLALTSYLSTTVIKTNNHKILQAPRGRKFCFAVLVYFLRNHLGLHQNGTY